MGAGQAPRRGSLAAVLFLAGARLRHRPARWLLVALGMAGAAVLPVLTANRSSIVAAKALRRGMEALPAGQRSLTVSYDALQLARADLAALDGQARARLTGLSAQPARRRRLYRRLAEAAGGSFSLGAAGQLPGAVRITAGRAPTGCRPERCEVLVVGDGTPRPDPALGLVIVGRAVRTDPLLLSGPFAPGRDAPLLLVDGVEPASRIAALALFERASGWVTPVALDRVRQLGVAGSLARGARVPDAGRWGPGLVLTAPDDVLRAEDSRAHRSAGRFALLGGAAVVLLLGFAVIGAIGLRRDHGAVAELLRRRGSARRAVRLLTGIHAAAPVLVGTVAGLAAGAGLAAYRGAATGLPAWASARDAVTGAAVPVGVGAAAAVAIVAATLSARGTASAAAVRRAVDLTVLAGLAIAALALSRGAVTTGQVGGDPLLLALPVLAVVCGGLAASRLWPVLVNPLGRMLPRRWIGARLGLLGALRRPLRPVATVAFVAAAVAIVVFAGAYRATLAQGAVDQAAFAVPLDARVGIGPGLERPLDVAGLAGFAATPPGGTVDPGIPAAARGRVPAPRAGPPGAGGG